MHGPVPRSCSAEAVIGSTSARAATKQLVSRLVESAQFRDEEKKLLSAAQPEVPADLESRKQMDERR